MVKQKPLSMEEDFQQDLSHTIGKELASNEEFTNVVTRELPLQANTATIISKASNWQNQLKATFEFGVPLAYVPAKGAVEIKLEVFLDADDRFDMTASEGHAELWSLDVDISQYLNQSKQIATNVLHNDISFDKKIHNYAISAFWYGIVKPNLPKTVKIRASLDVFPQGTSDPVATGSWVDGAQMVMFMILSVRYLYDTVRPHDLTATDADWSDLQDTHSDSE